MRIFPIIITDPRGNEARARPEILKHLRMEWDKTKRIVGCWDAELFRLHASAWDDNTLLAESLLSLQGALAATRPAFVVVPGADASATFDAALIAPRQLQIPVLQLDPAINCATKLAVLPAIDGSTVCVPEVEHVTTLLSGLVHRTNSVRALLQRAMNIMCTCEQVDSVRTGGAFARCPTREAQDSLLSSF
ncbi:MAG: hypothetical protein EOO65_04425 [Methanosarcinales archaeon]|nr:MAG: hypothetical protein EOO65_04425 [Methanosarcinales archaeon]